MNTEIQQVEKSSPRRELMALLALGSLWGLSEVILSGIIQAAGIPLRSGILTGLGLAFVAVYLGIFRRGWAPIPMAIVAVLCKQLVVPILHVSPMCKANACLNLLLMGVGVAICYHLLGRKAGRSVWGKGLCGALVGGASAASFYVIGLRLAPCAYLKTYDRAGGFVSFMTIEGIPWMLFAAVLFPIGFHIGLNSREKVLAWAQHRPAMYYSLTSTWIAIAWAACAVAIKAGL